MDAVTSGRHEQSGQRSHERDRISGRLWLKTFPLNGRALKRISINIERRATNPPSFKLRATYASADAFDDQRSFQLGNGADDYDDCSTEGCQGRSKLK